LGFEHTDLREYREQEECKTEETEVDDQINAAAHTERMRECDAQVRANYQDHSGAGKDEDDRAIPQSRAHSRAVEKGAAHKQDD